MLQRKTGVIILAMVSAVIPTFNAEAGLPRCFEGLFSAAMSGLVREVIVADAGSTDRTCAIADGAGARIVQTQAGKGSQLAKGADAARGDWLLFLDPDTMLEPGWDAEVVSFIERSTPERPRAASFRFALDDFGPEARRLEALVALRCALFALPHGDQGLLIPTRLYRKLGGYRAVAAMEDVDLVRRIGRRRLVMLRSRAIASSARYRERGYFHRATRRLGISILQGLRVPLPYVARLGG